MKRKHLYILSVSLIVLLIGCAQGTDTAVTDSSSIVSEASMESSASSVMVSEDSIDSFASSVVVSESIVEVSTSDISEDIPESQASSTSQDVSEESKERYVIEDGKVKYYDENGDEQLIHIPPRKTYVIDKSNYLDAIEDAQLNLIVDVRWERSDRMSREDFQSLVRNLMSDQAYFSVAMEEIRPSIGIEEVVGDYFEYSNYYDEDYEYFVMANHMIDGFVETLQGLSDYEIALRSYQYVMQKANYYSRYEEFKDSFMEKWPTALHGLHARTYPAALIDGEAICNSFSSLYYVILKKAGVPVHMVGGLLDPEGIVEAHVWNFVEIGGNWYHVDVTFEDAQGAESPSLYQYFLLSDQDMAYRSWQSEYYPKAPKNYKELAN